jgi:general secretion pathway protein J
MSLRAYPARAAGFTLLELLIALSIVSVLLAIAFGGLRMGIVAWSRGEDRAEVQQRARGLSQILVRTVGGAYPYQGELDEAGVKHMLFTGAEHRVELVSQSPALPSGVPAAFTAIVIALEDDAQGRALVVRQRVLPNRNPFKDATIALRDPTVQGLEFSYLSAEGSWADTWDADNDKKLPSAIRIRISTLRGDRLEPSTPITVSLRTVGGPVR